MREATIATSLLIDFLGFLGRRGLAAETVCRAAQIDPAWADDPNSRVPAAAMERLWAAAERLTGDADLGLHSAESYNPGALSIVGYVILSCRTAGEALERLARYAPLLNEGLKVRVEHAQDTTICSIGAADDLGTYLRRSPRQVIETVSAGIVLTLGRVATRPPVPIAVTFQHAAPASIAEHARLLGPVVRFDQIENAVVYSTSALAAGMLSADPALLEVFEGIVSGISQSNGRKVTSFVQVGKGTKITYNPELKVGKRLLSLEIKGEEVVKEKEYKVVTLDFLAGGGDNFWEKRTEGVIALDLEVDVLVGYIKKMSPVDVKVEGRIVVTNETVGRNETREGNGTGVPTLTPTPGIAGRKGGVGMAMVLGAVVCVCVLGVMGF